MAQQTNCWVCKKFVNFGTESRFLFNHNGAPIEYHLCPEHAELTKLFLEELKQDG